LKKDFLLGIILKLKQEDKIGANKMTINLEQKEIKPTFLVQNRNM
jgi:hypothetical protein